MARITVDDCLGAVNNRFELVLLATLRSRQLERTMAQPMVDPGNDKPTVIALREIASGHMNFTVVNEVEKALDNRDGDSLF